MAPVFKIYGEDYQTLFDEIRGKGFRTIKIDGVHHNLGDKLELEEDGEYFMEVIVDKLVVKPNI